MTVKTWTHPGGKLREMGADTLSDTELLAILISTGFQGKPAAAIAEEVMLAFGGLSKMSRVPLEDFLKFKGLSDVKITRIAAALEIGRRLAREALQRDS